MGMKPRQKCRSLFSINITNVDTKGMEIYLKEEHNFILPEDRIRSIFRNSEPKYFSDALDNFLSARTDREKEIALLFLIPFFERDKSPA